MVGKPMRGKRILEMLEHLYENTGYEVLKKTEVRGEKAWERKCQKPAVQRTTEEEEKQRKHNIVI